MIIIHNYTEIKRNKVKQILAKKLGHIYYIDILTALSAFKL